MNGYDFKGELNGMGGLLEALRRDIADGAAGVADPVTTPDPHEANLILGALITRIEHFGRDIDHDLLGPPVDSPPVNGPPPPQVVSPDGSATATPGVPAPPAAPAAAAPAAPAAPVAPAAPASPPLVPPDDVVILRRDVEDLTAAVQTLVRQLGARAPIVSNEPAPAAVPAAPPLVA